MSKLSPSLKALIAAPYARPNTLPAPPQIRNVYAKIWDEGAAHKVGMRSWLALSTAATMTMNSPESMSQLYELAANKSKDKTHSLQTAEIMREVGFKCIGFNGIPRTINMLGAFRASLPSEIVSSLNTKPARIPTTSNLSAIIERGNALWKSVYHPFDGKLEAKLAESHPDLPVHILNHEYGALFADPESGVPNGAKVGRVLTSIVAVSCLRAQGGVGPQVISHVFGLRKAFEDGSAKAEGEDGEGERWLASDKGGEWLLGSVDSVVNAIGEGNGSGFASGLENVKSKL